MRKNVWFIGLLAIAAIGFACVSTSPIPATKMSESVMAPPQLPASLPPPPIGNGVERNKVYRVIFDVPQYLVGPGDVLEIVLRRRSEEEAHTVVVRPNGTISVSFLDDLKVLGLTTSQIDALITQELDRFVKNPRVDVLVKGYNSKKVSLFGEINILETGVSGPGNYPLIGKTTLIDLLVTAGGAKTTADLKIVKLIREGESYMLNLYKAMFEGNIQHNIILDAGDVVIVPELSTIADKVIVLGEVGTPGIHPFKQQIDVASAVGLAGGYGLDAAEESTLVIRKDITNPNTPRVFRVDLKKLFKKGDLAQNIALQSGDIVYVPRSFIADAAYFASRITPILDILTYPGVYRDLYTTGGGLRIDTGFPKTREGAPSTIFTIPVTRGQTGGTGQ